MRKAPQERETPYNINKWTRFSASEGGVDIGLKLEGETRWHTGGFFESPEEVRDAIEYLQAWLDHYEEDEP